MQQLGLGSGDLSDQPRILDTCYLENIATNGRASNTTRMAAILPPLT